MFGVSPRIAESLHPCPYPRIRFRCHPSPGIHTLRTCLGKVRPLRRTLSSTLSFPCPLIEIVTPRITSWAFLQPPSIVRRCSPQPSFSWCLSFLSSGLDVGPEPQVYSQPPKPSRGRAMDPQPTLFPASNPLNPERGTNQCHTPISPGRVSPHLTEPQQTGAPSSRIFCKTLPQRSFTCPYGVLNSEAISVMCL